MKLKRYTLLSILLLVALGVYIYVNVSADYTARFGSSEITLPVAVWVIIPALIVFAASLAHMGFYSAVGFFRRYALEKDLKSLKKLITHSLLGQTGDIELKHPQLVALGRVLAGSRILPMEGEIKTADKDLDKLLDLIQAVQRGEVVDFGSLRPDRQSPVWVQNQLNRLGKDVHASEEILRECKAPGELCARALEAYATYGDKRRVLKGDIPVTPVAALNLLARYGAEENALEFDTDEAAALCRKAGFAERDYIRLAKVLKSQVNPDALLALFFQLKRDHEAASAAWIYLNLELERHDEVRDMLETSGEDEYLPFKSYLALKKAGLGPKLDEMIR